MSQAERVQLQLRIPYKHEPTRHFEVERRLADGWRIEEYHRLSDQEVVVTFVRPDAPAGA